MNEQQYLKNHPLYKCLKTIDKHPNIFEMNEKIYDIIHNKQGFVYIASYKDENLGGNIYENTYKIGGSKKENPFLREKSLNVTNAIGVFRLEKAYKFLCTYYNEVYIHKYFSDYRINKEFFKVEIEKIEEILDIVTDYESCLLKYINVDIIDDKEKFLKNGLFLDEIINDFSKYT